MVGVLSPATQNFQVHEQACGNGLKVNHVLWQTSVYKTLCYTLQILGMTGIGHKIWLHQIPNLGYQHLYTSDTWN